MTSSVGVEFGSYVGVREEVVEALSVEKFGGKRLVDVDCTLASTTCAPMTGFSFTDMIARKADSREGIQKSPVPRCSTTILCSRLWSVSF